MGLPLANSMVDMETKMTTARETTSMMISETTIKVAPVVALSISMVVVLTLSTEEDNLVEEAVKIIFQEAQ